MATDISIRRIASLLAWPWAFVGVPLAWWALLQGEWSYSLDHGTVPLTYIEGWGTFLLYLQLTLVLGSGVFCVAAETRRRRILWAILYALPMCAAMLFIGFHVSCNNGDCL